MTDHWHWPELREKAIRLFRGELPKPDTENTIIEAFKKSPAAISRLVNEIGTDIDAGKDIRSGWAVLKTRCNAIFTTAPNITATDETDKQRRLRAALAWIHNAGLYCDRYQDVHDELFTSPGLLAQWPDDTDLHRQARQAWERERPRGVKAEQESEDRAAHYVKQRRELAAKLEQARAAALAAAEQPASDLAGSAA